MPLTIRRNPGESIMLFGPNLPGDITVTVRRIEANRTISRAFLSIEAPRSILVARAEALPVIPEQGEQSGPFFQVDREAAKLRIFPQTRAYIERLEAIVRNADVFWQSMQTSTMTPEQFQASEQLYEALASVNFLDEDEQHAAAS